MFDDKPIISYGNGCEVKKFETVDETIDFFLLTAQRRLFICSSFDDELARDIVRKVWFLASISKEPITLYINSGGGSVTAGLAIWDQILEAGVEIRTVVTGMAASMGAMLMLVGDKGKRYATENARIMIHEPSMGEIEGQTSDLMIRADEIVKNRTQLVKLMHERTLVPESEIAKMISRDYWMSAKEAKECGLIDEVLESSKVPA